MPLKLLLRNPLPHRTGATHAPRNHFQHLIHIIRARPFLMRDHITLELHLRLLDQRAVSPHSLFRKRLGELV